MATEEGSEELKEHWDIFGIGQRRIMRLGRADLKKDAAIQNASLYTDIGIRGH
jgi:hypothetical protein